MRRHPWSQRLLLVLVVVMVAGAAGCGGSGDGETEPVTVFAAASLTEAFTEVASAFETTPGGAAVELNFGASSALREQILAGAPADVFASSNPSNMTQLVEAGAVADPVDFVANQLQIAVPPGNPAGVTGLGDFTDPELLFGLCAEDVPCGQFGRTALANADVTPSIDTNEPDVRSLLTKVQAGELDAGIVYRSDVIAAGMSVEGVDIPLELNVVATYPIAVLADAANPEGGDAFVGFVLSEQGQAILTSYGFEVP